MRLLYLVLVSALCGLNALSADRTVRILYYGAPADSKLRTAFIYGGQHEPIQVSLNRFNFSDQIPISDELTVFRVLPKALGEEAEFPKRTPTVSIPLNWEDTLLIFFHHPGNQIMPIRIAKINASAGVFNPGEFCWVNLSEVAVGGTVGGKQLRLPPQKTRITKCPTDRSECAVKLDFVLPGETTPRALIRQMWSVDKQTRQVVFILNKPAPQLAGYYVLPIREP